MSSYIRPLLLLVLSLLCTCARAQLPSLSPLGTVTQVVGNTTIGVSYERPSARGRQVFGSLVPWGKVWRTGAGYCTKIAFDRPVTVGGQPVPAGKYALLTVPTPTEWTIILNRDTTLYGARDYDPAQDVIRFRVLAKTSTRYYEALTIDLDVIPDDVRLYLSWANVSVDFPIRTDTYETVLQYVNGLLEQPAATEVDYAWPAEYLLLSRQNLPLAQRLLDRQLSIAPSESAWRVQMELFAYLGYRDRALDTARRGLAYVQDGSLDEQNKAWSINYWREQITRLSQ